MMIPHNSKFLPSRLFGATQTSLEGPTRRRLADSSNSTTSVNGDDLTNTFNQNNTALSMSGLNNHAILTGYNNTLTVSGDGGTVNITGDDNTVLVKGFHITTWDAGNNNSVTAQGVSDPIHKVPAPPAQNTSVPVPAPSPLLAPCMAPAPAPQTGRRLMAVSDASGFGTDLIHSVPRAPADGVQFGAVFGLCAVVGIVAYGAGRFFGENKHKEQTA